MKKLLIIFFLLFIAVFVAVGSIFLTKDNQQVRNQIHKSENTTSQKTCPAGFVLVPGSKLYKTSDFCVMKYDAKCADIANPNIGLSLGAGNSCSGLSVED